MLGTNRKKLQRKIPTNLLVQLHTRKRRQGHDSWAEQWMQEHLKTSSHYEVWSKAREAGGYLENIYVSYGLRKVPLKM